MPIGGAGGGGGTGDIQAGGAFVRIYSKDELSKTLDKLRAKFNAFGSFINKIGNQAALGGTAILAPLTALFTGGVNRAANVGRLAEQFGTSAEQMSRFAWAAEDAGVSLEEVIKNQERYAAVMAQAPVFDSQTAKDAIATQRAFRSAWVSLQAAMLPLLNIIVPLIQTFAQFVKENAHLVLVAAAVGAGLIAIGAAAKVVAISIAAVTAALGLLKAAAVFLGPGGLIAVGLAAVGVALASLTPEASDVGESFKQMGETAKSAWGGIVEALKKGDLELAAEIAFAAIETLWHQLVVGMTQAIDKFFVRVFGQFAQLAKIIAFVGGPALLGAAIGGPIGAAIGAAIGAGALLLKETLQEYSEVALPRAQRRLAKAVQQARTDPRTVTEIPSISPLAALNAANVKGTFSGPLRQQLGIGDSFENKLLANTEEANGLLGGILKEVQKDNGAKFK